MPSKTTTSQRASKNRGSKTTSSQKSNTGSGLKALHKEAGSIPKEPSRGHTLRGKQFRQDIDTIESNIRGNNAKIENLQQEIKPLPRMPKKKKMPGRGA